MSNGHGFEGDTVGLFSVFWAKCLYFSGISREGEVESSRGGREPSEAGETRRDASLKARCYRFVRVAALHLREPFLILSVLLWEAVCTATIAAR